MARRRVIYDGKAKTVYEGPEAGTLIQYFKDDATAFNNQKHEIVSGKGVLNNRISAHIMSMLEMIGIPTAFLRSVNMREQLVREVEIVPVEVVVRNIAAGSLCKRFNLQEGLVLPKPLIEFYYKNDELGDPLSSEDHVITFGWADAYEMEEIVAQSMRVNDYLNGLFAGIGISLVDFKLEFGRIYGEEGELYLVLADEISPDNCRLWDRTSGEKLDKDRFRHNLGDLVEGYQDIARRLGLVPESGIIEDGDINEQAAASLEDIENARAGDNNLRSIRRSAGKSSPRKS